MPTTSSTRSTSAEITVTDRAWEAVLAALPYLAGILFVAVGSVLAGWASDRVNERYSLYAKQGGATGSLPKGFEPFQIANSAAWASDYAQVLPAMVLAGLSLMLQSLSDGRAYAIAVGLVSFVTCTVAAALLLGWLQRQDHDEYRNDGWRGLSRAAWAAITANVAGAAFAIFLVATAASVDREGCQLPGSTTSTAATVGVAGSATTLTIPNAACLPSATTVPIPVG